MTAAEKKQTTRQRLLGAASTVILKQGTQALTLEAVALEAGVSKGGLLYHFPSKDQLIQGLIDQLIEDFYARLNAALAVDPDPAPGRWLRAYIRATFAPGAHEGEISAALAIAIASRPDLLDGLRASFATMRQQAESDGLDPALANLIRLAADGYWYNDVLGLAPLAEPTRSQLMQRLLDLTKGTSQ